MFSHGQILSLFFSSTVANKTFIKDWSEENAGAEIEKSGNEVEDNISNAPSLDTPSKVRKRFGISFLDRSGN